VTASKPTKTIEIFRPGTFTTRAGDEITFSAADLVAVAGAYDPALHQAPLVAGHPKHDDPAQGWVQRVEFVDGRLVAEVDQVNPQFAAAVGRGEYKRVSAAFYPPASKANPKPGQYYLRHVGCLGAIPPAVSGLKPLQFSAGDTDFVEFGQDDMPLGPVFRQLRDWLIGKFGLADADQALPGWIVSQAEDADREETEDTADGACGSCGSASFSNHDQGVDMTTKPDQAALDKRAAELEAQAQAFAKKEIAFAELERGQRRKDDEGFLEGLIAKGQFLPAQKANTLAFMESVAETDQVIEFAEGDGTKAKVSLRDAFRRHLSAIPKMVEFGEIAPGDGSGATSVEFAAPAGAIVDPDRLRLHGMALAYQRQHPDQSYIQAVKAVAKE